MKLIKQYSWYLIRWQLSTPILAGVLIVLSDMNKWVATILANLLGGLLFFWIDRWIFKNTVLAPLWEIQEEVKCVDCGQVSKGFRLVKTNNYDRTNDKSPEYRCERCSKNKLQELKKRGVEGV